MFVSNNSLLSDFPDTTSVCFYLESLVEGPDGCDCLEGHLHKPLYKIYLAMELYVYIWAATQQGKVSEYDQEIPQSHTADQPSAP